MKIKFEKSISYSITITNKKMLSSSLTGVTKEPVSPKKGWASRFSGVWQDSRSAEEIVEDIRSARTTYSFDVEQ